MLKILQARLHQYVNHELPDIQARFRKAIGTRDQMANICWIIEKAREFQKVKEENKKVGLKPNIQKAKIMTSGPIRSEIRLPTSTGSLKKQKTSRKSSVSALLTTPKPLTVWITINCGKF